MVRTLVIGDLHFDNKPYGLVNAQAGTTLCIYREALKKGLIDHVIFLGDLLMHRKPYPRVLLALKEVLDEISSHSMVYILRGNHDSENKSDDGVTALSLFSSSRVKVVTQTWIDDENKRVFIPHYEDETKIKKALENAPKGYRVFGHFGYYGSLNSAGDADFSIGLPEFRNSTMLGHIHRFNQRTLQPKGSVETITLLGTPYTTNFAEYRKENFYGIIDGEVLTTHPIEYGPRHLVIDYDKVEENIDWINDPNYFTLLRINMSTIDESQDSIAELSDKLAVGHLEVKYKPLLDTEEEYSASVSESNPVLEINEDLIEDYINSSSTTLSKESLLSGLQLINDNQQNRD
jgi:DNA repair exonuclease SbcCD nuclease subunit